MNRKLFFLKLSCFNILIALSIFLVQCKHDAQGLDSQPVVSFKTQILPVFQGSCAKSDCHNGSSHLFGLNSYSSIMNNISAGDPINSEAYTVMTSAWIQPMPPKPAPPVPQESRTLIFLWIKQGAKDN